MTGAMEIKSVGPPPELHADRVVALMLRHLAQQKANLWDIIDTLVKNTPEAIPRLRQSWSSVSKTPVASTQAWTLASAGGT
jgi:hypothetical protein